MTYSLTLAAAQAPLSLMTPLATSFDWTHHMSSHAVPLPPLALMNRVGAPDAANFLYVCDQWSQVAGRQMKPGTRVLDIGAGCGKPARAFLHNPNVIEYVGIDVDPELVNWSNAYLRPVSSKRFLFAWLNVQSDFYAPAGAVRAEEAEFPVEPGNFNFVIAASLFTHLEEKAALNYLKQARRACTPGAQMLVSIHIEPSAGLADGNTQRADYTSDYFVQLAAQASWKVAAVIGELAGQESILFSAS